VRTSSSGDGRSVWTHSGHSSEQRVKNVLVFLAANYSDLLPNFSNSAAVLPKLDVTNVGHLLGAYLCLVIINALMVDSFNVMAGRGE
jgi:hypothetical protein